MEVVWFGLAIVLVGFSNAVMLRSGGWGRYPFLFLYLLVGLVFQVTGLVIYTHGGGSGSHRYIMEYWTSDVVLHGLLFLALLFLIREALVGNRGPDISTFMIVAPLVTFVGVTLYLLYNPQVSGRGWIFPLSRNLSFIEELLNFVLWTILIRNRSRDVILLLVSAGLGIQVTGEVIGRTIRLYTDSPSISWLPDAIVLLCEAAALLIWYRAFRAYGRQRAESRPSPAI